MWSNHVRAVVFLLPPAMIVGLAVAQTKSGDNGGPKYKQQVVGGVLVEIGEPKTVIPPSRELRYFPDEPVGVIKNAPFTFTLVNGQFTLLMSGQSIETAVSLGKVLGPGGKGEFDNGYAGISGIHRDSSKGELSEEKGISPIN